ncbi:MAG: hypothetical protein S4CHLAM6_09840 [Chlamydiae bacterium]|nr:hypothetical protein [Chlamydiota bacterium]
MEKVEVKRTLEEEKVFAALKFDVNIALGGMVIPSLRAVAINWEPGKIKAQLVFFHDGLADEPIEWHYNCIEVDCNGEPEYLGTPILMQIKIISSPFPMLLPEVSEIVYLRKEESSPFNEINKYVPDWTVGSVIRLKVNEALRGKVTGDLRAIHLTWDETNTEAQITFFHNSAITDEIYKHYEEIFNIATLTADQWKKDGKKVVPRLAVKSVAYPDKIERPKNLDRLYSRKEPFTDKPIGEN